MELHPSLVVLQRRFAGLHVGGKTALDWYGVRHYLEQRPVLQLYGWAAGHLPDWFTERFPADYHRKRLFNESPTALLHAGPFERRDGAPHVSAPERALLEVLSEVGVRQSLAEARDLVESTYSLRADILRDLLKQCTSVKTVRLCLQLGRELSMPWAAKLAAADLPAGGGPAWVSKTSRRWLAGAQAVNQTYLDTARLLTQVAPFVFTGDTFALKGGTAINLFVRDMPRLSVDLDLVFPDYLAPRAEALQAIAAALRQSAARLKARGCQTRTTSAPDAEETKLFRSPRPGRGQDPEVNFVMHRGPVFSSSPGVVDADGPSRPRCWPTSRSLWSRWKTCTAASLSRRWTDNILAICSTSCSSTLMKVSPPGIRQAFVVCLTSHNRHVHEGLFPSLKDLQFDYDHNFRGHDRRGPSATWTN